MKPLKFMDDEVQRMRCNRCDYLNNKVAIDDKKPNCTGIDNLIECEAYMKTQKLKSRIGYINGTEGPVFFDYSNGQGEIYTFDD